jgi:GxxExxY protein
VVDAAFAVHTRLGPGLLENVYEICLAYEIGKRGITAARQVTLPITYRGIRLEPQLRLDLVVGDCVVVEVKATDTLAPVHTAQMLTYLKLSGMRLGLLINFNVGAIKDGIKRIAL